MMGPGFCLAVSGGLGCRKVAVFTASGGVYSWGVCRNPGWYEIDTFSSLLSRNAGAELVT